MPFYRTVNLVCRWCCWGSLSIAGAGFLMGRTTTPEAGSGDP